MSDVPKCMLCNEPFGFGEKARATVEWYPAGVIVEEGLLLMSEQLAHADGCPDAAAITRTGERP